MTLEYLATAYNASPWTLKPNKLKFPKTILTIDQIDEFNEVYLFLKNNPEVLHIEPTKSGGMPIDHTKMNSRFITVVSKTSIEISACLIDGCFRLILKMGKLPDDNKVSGSKALKELLNLSKEYEVFEIFKDNAVSKDEGLKIKEEIETPIIRVERDVFVGNEFTNVHHLDLNSSYASRIVEEYPELKPMYEYLYNNRKNDNGYYKHILTNSIGCMQSNYCFNVNEDGYFRKSPYQLAKFAKVAINGNNKIIRELIAKLNNSGRIPLLINTDGIWYKGDIYEDENCGTNLGQYKTDHKNCDLYIKSVGAYQYKENGIVHTVVRGTTPLDVIKPDRDTWKWREIDDMGDIKRYKFDEELGVIEICED